MNMLDLFERRMLKLRKEAKLGLFACQPCLYPIHVGTRHSYAWSSKKYLLGKSCCGTNTCGRTGRNKDGTVLKS
jgi:hypothetical protein